MSEKILIIMLLVAVLINLLPVISNGVDMETALAEGNGFIREGNIDNSMKIKVKELSNSIVNILMMVGVAVAVIVSAVLGIQFMTGTIEDQVKVKETTIPFIVGCIVVFGAFGIWKLVVQIVQSGF